MSDIELYEKSAGEYDELQHKRPDYRGALDAFIDLAYKVLKGKKEIFIADFCCGIGNNTKALAGKISVKKATLIDINKEFLELAKKSGIKALELDTVHGDILQAKLKPDHDVVISMFAYHHVPDNRKADYIKQVKNALKKGGVLLLGEIYSPDKKTTLAYYEHLLNSIPAEERTPELEKFLRQTANSDHFEYKVSREFAHKQLEEAGFELGDSIKIWPTDKVFSKDVGTFVEVWKMV